MKITKTTTGLIIREPSPEIKQKCLQYFSLSNPTREFFIYCGDDPDNSGLFGGQKDVIYITSGFSKINDPVIVKTFRNVDVLQPSPGKHVTIKMNREPRSKLQEDCIEKVTATTASKITIEAKPGTGKAAPYSTRIPTPTKEGFTLMGDLKVGNRVFSKDGTPTVITGIFEQGEQDVYKLTFQDGRTSYCTKEHLWTVRRKQSDEWVTLQLQEMLEHVDRYTIPLCDPVVYPKQYTPIRPWVIGVLLHSGCDVNGELSIHSIGPVLPSLMANLCGLTCSYRNDMSNTYTFYYNTPVTQPVDARKFLKEVYEDVIKLRRIPSIYMMNDSTTRDEILGGLLCASDEENLYKCMEALKEEPYYDQMTWLYHSLGYRPFASQDDLAITDIQFDHREECRCIMVDHPDHLYLTDDFIVTHNTFMTLYSISKMGLKPLIITPSTLLKNQWIENLVDLGIDLSDIAKDIYDSPNKTFCVVTISSLENAMRDDWNRLMKTLKDADFGIKIVDEAHLHLKGLLKLDAICNIKHNWYLSATLGRSDMSEDRILNRALKDAERFIGNSKYEEYQDEYVKVYFQDIYYHPSARLCNQHFKYGSKGLIRATYYNMLMNYGGGKPFINNIITLIKRTESIIGDGKILILVPIIKTIEAVVEAMHHDPYFNKYTISGVDGSMSITTKRHALESDIIISTSMSMGVGVDIAKLASVINFDQYASPIITEQIFGRLRNLHDGKPKYYIDICDHVKYAKVIETWGRKRRILVPYFPGADSKIEYLKNIHC